MSHKLYSYLTAIATTRSEARNLLLKHIDIATIAEATGLNHDEIAELQRELAQ